MDAWDANDRQISVGDRVRAWDPNRNVYVTARVEDIDDEQKHKPVLILKGQDFWTYADETERL